MLVVTLKTWIHFYSSSCSCCSLLSLTILIVKSVRESAHPAGSGRRCYDKLISDTEIKQEEPPCCGEPGGLPGHSKTAFLLKPGLRM